MGKRLFGKHLLSVEWGPTRPPFMISLSWSLKISPAKDQWWAQKEDKVQQAKKKQRLRKKAAKAAKADGNQNQSPRASQGSQQSQLDGWLCLGQKAKDDDETAEIVFDAELELERLDEDSQ